MESQSLPGLSIIKVFLHPQAKVEAAVAQLAAASQAVLYSLPTGMTPPSILRYNASSVPIHPADERLVRHHERVVALRPRIQLHPHPKWLPCKAPLPAPVRRTPSPDPRQSKVDIDLKSLYAQGLSANDVVNAASQDRPNEFVVRLGAFWLRPFLRAVENAVDFDNLFADAINRQKGKPGKHKLAGA